LKLKTDILVIGSGIAGLSFALKASKYAKVLIITKKEKAESNTNYAQGGVASVMSADDNFELHIADTLEAGAGLCHLDAVTEIVEKGPELINELIRLGVDFSKHEGVLDLGREGGHSKKRIVHSKDLTGKAIEKALLYNIAINKNITLFEHHTAVDLITEHNLKGKKKKSLKKRHCFGAYVYDEKRKKVLTIGSKLTVICSGGIGQVYLHTTNPSIATGDGIAMAYRSGCIIGDMEFVQFHPTSLFQLHHNDSSQAFLITEALRGAGAILKTKDGKTFMEKYDKRASLAPRDIVARAIDKEMKKRGDNYVFLDATQIKKELLKEKFPNIYKVCLAEGIDITKDFIPVVPAAHYICGGVVTDLNGRSSLGNLYVLGESAMTGVHGANRLASNSLLEALVFADTASVSCKKDLKENEYPVTVKDIPEWDISGTENSEEWVLVSQDKVEIKHLMSNYVGIVRSNLRLHRALGRINYIRKEIEDYYKKTTITRELLELRNIALVSYIIIRSALMRKESRGLHFSTDYPKLNKKYLKDTIISNKIV